MPDVDWKSLILLVVFMIAPAVIFVTVFTIIRRRRGKFHRQRITKGSTHRNKETS